MYVANAVHTYGSKTTLIGDPKIEHLLEQLYWYIPFMQVGVPFSMFKCPIFCPGPL